MSLKVFFTDDITSILIALDRATDALPLEGDAYAEGYRIGYGEALAAAAIAFGVATPEPKGTAWHVVDVEHVLEQR